MFARLLGEDLGKAFSDRAATGMSPLERAMDGAFSASGKDFDWAEA
jgi:hypothetical protein